MKYINSPAYKESLGIDPTAEKKPYMQNPAMGQKGNTVPYAGYVCKRCNKPGHFIKFCPTNDDPKFNPYSGKGVPIG